MATPTAVVPEFFIKLNSAEDARLLSEGLDALKDNKTVVLQDLKKRVSVAVRYFKSLNSTALLKIAADKRNNQRRRDGRG